MKRLLRHCFKKQWEGLWFTIALIIDNLLICILIIIIALGIMHVLGETFSWNTISIAVFVSILCSLSIGLMKKYGEYKQHFSILEQLNENTFNILKQFRNVIEEPMLTEFISEIVNKSVEQFGGIVIGVTSDKYLEYLEKLTQNAKKSFWATLRGGYKPEYTLRWFFKDNEDRSLTAAEKQQYLGFINQSSILEKIRIIILKKDEMCDFCNDRYRKAFFDLNKNVDVYLIDPDVLVKALSSRYELTETQCSFIWEDYAIFDEKIALKHNGRNILYLGVQNQISAMKKVFEFLKKKLEIGDPLPFIKLTKDNIGSQSWEDWKKKYCKNKK